MLSSGEDESANATNDETTVLVDNTTAADAFENDDIVEDEVENDNAVYEDVFEEGIITSIENDYFDDGIDDTIGTEFLDFSISNTYVTKSICFEDLFPCVDLESGEDISSSVPICQHCRSSGHSVNSCLLLSIDPTIVQCSSINASNIMSLHGTIQSSSIAQLLSSSGHDTSSGFGAALLLPRLILLLIWMKTMFFIFSMLQDLGYCIHLWTMLHP